MFNKRALFYLSVSILTVPVIAQAQENFSQASHSQNSFISGPEAGGFSLTPHAPQDATMVNDADVSYMGSSPREMNNFKKRAFKITPFANVNVTYSDNVNLDHENEESGMLYGGAAGIRADMVTNRLDAAGTAAANISWGSDYDTQFSPFVEAAATAELLRNRLYVDALANYSTIFNNASSYTSQSGASSGDIEGIGSVSVSPYWRQKIGNWAVGELRYGYDQSFNNSDNLGDLRSHSYQATLGTGDRFNRISVEGSIGHIDSDYNAGLGNDGDMSQTTYLLSGTYGVTKTLSLIGNVGYDSVSDTNVGDNEFSGASYHAGLQYTPNSRMSVRGLIGRRYNDMSYSIDANYNVNERVYVGATAQTQLLPLLAMPIARSLQDKVQEHYSNVLIQVFHLLKLFEQYMACKMALFLVTLTILHQIQLLLEVVKTSHHSVLNL